MFGNTVRGMYSHLVFVVFVFVWTSSSQERPPPDQGLSPPHEAVSLEDKAASLVDKLSASCDTSHILARLILQETEERAKLEERMRVQMARQENVTRMQEELRKALTDLTAKAQEKEPFVAFTAKVTSHWSGLTHSQTVVFGTVETNQGEAYNPQTGIFTCPVNGIYQFYVSILSQPNKRIETFLTVKGEEKLLLYSSAGEHHHGSLGTGTIILELKKGDNVEVKINLGNYIHCCWSTFSGRLLRGYVE